MVSKEEVATYLQAVGSGDVEALLLFLRKYHNCMTYPTDAYSPLPFCLTDDCLFSIAECELMYSFMSPHSVIKATSTESAAATTGMCDVILTVHTTDDPRLLPYLNKVPKLTKERALMIFHHALIMTMLNPDPDRRDYYAMLLTTLWPECANGIHGEIVRKVEADDAELTTS